MTRKVKSAGRFGPRYGRTIREKIIKIEKKQKSWQTCPSCFQPRVKRVSLGIWHCEKCNLKFTGKAYEV